MKSESMHISIICNIEIGPYYIVSTSDRCCILFDDSLFDGCVSYGSVLDPSFEKTNCRP